MNYRWKPEKSFSLPNLNILVVNDVEVGFIQKPRDTRFDKNMWRCFTGIGIQSKFIGHAGSKGFAKKILEGLYCQKQKP
jgi:hypothetical protein